MGAIRADDRDQPLRNLIAAQTKAQAEAASLEKDRDNIFKIFKQKHEKYIDDFQKLKPEQHEQQLKLSNEFSKYFQETAEKLHQLSTKIDKIYRYTT